MPIRYFMTFLCLLGALPAWAVQRADSKEQLRRLAQLPDVPFPSAYTYDPRTGFAVLKERSDPAAVLIEEGKKISGTPADAARFFRIGELYLELRDRPKARAAFQRAAELYRRQLELQTGNPASHRGLGRSLGALKQDKEAEFHLREALRTAPADPDNWLAWGELHENRAWDFALQAVPALWQSPFVVALDQAQGKALPPEVLKEMNRALETATESFSKAVELKPEAKSTRTARARHYGLKQALQQLHRAERVKGQPDDDLLPGIFSRESAADLARLAEIDSQNLTALAMPAFLEIASCLARLGARAGGDALSLVWSELPEQSRQLIRTTMGQLDQAGERANKAEASAAMELLGILQFWILQDLPGARISLRRALELDPSREIAWDTLTQLYFKDDPVKAIELCAERLNHKNTTRTRLLLAKAYEKAGDTRAAERQVYAALAIDNNDFTANLAMASVLLKLSDNTGYLGRVRDALNKAEQKLSNSSSSRQVIELAVAKSIYYGLSDNFEMARQVLKGVLGVARDNRQVQDVLLALGY